MLTCHLCGKLVVILNTHLQRTHKWSKKEAKEYQQRTVFVEGSKTLEEGLTPSPSTAPGQSAFVHLDENARQQPPPKPFSFGIGGEHDDATSSSMMIGPARKLTWEEMAAAADEGYDGGDNREQNAYEIRKAVRRRFQQLNNTLELMYTDLHRNLADVIFAIDGQRDDVSAVIRGVLEPSLTHLRRGNESEMRHINRTMGDIISDRL